MNTTQPRSNAVWYALVFGTVLTLIGVLGFFVNTSQDMAEPLLGFDVNLTHNLVHLASGVVGLIVGLSALMYARMYALVLGIVYTVLGVWGLVVGDGFDPFGLFASINSADNFLHLAIGLLGLGAWITTQESAHASDL